MVVRYLAAFGPATVADAAAWSRLMGLREVFDRLGPRLRAFRDADGRALFDLPEAPRPDPQTPAPQRFLPTYDNVLLSHAERSRFVSVEQRSRLARLRGSIHGSVLHDGRLRATWRVDRDGDTGSATQVVSHVDPLAKRATSTLAAEGRRLLRFLAAGAESHEVRFSPASTI